MREEGVKETRDRMCGRGVLDEFREAFGDLFEQVRRTVPAALEFPQSELRKVERGYRVVFALPGVRRADIELVIDDGTLVLTGERRPAAPRRTMGRVRRERPSGRFRRAVRLREPVDRARVSARLEDGLLTVELPRPEETETREISIEEGEV